MQAASDTLRVNLVCNLHVFHSEGRFACDLPL
jgi:hypothetical protein